MSAAPAWEVADAFDLPEWLADAFSWRAEETLAGSTIPGVVTGREGQLLELDLLCADVAFPAPVMGEQLRSRAHQAWYYSQVLLVCGPERRHTLAVPATAIGADQACEAMRRFGKAVGVSADLVSVTLRL